MFTSGIAMAGPSSRGHICRPRVLPESEKRVFAALARLPDDCLSYYEPVVLRRYPDLIALLPEVGVLVIKVKDWRLANGIGRDAAHF